MVNFLEGGFVMKSQNRAIALLMAVVMLASLLSISCLSISAETSPADLEYTISSGKVTITGIRDGVITVDLPASIAGYPVTAIAASAFAFSDLHYLFLPESITVIPDMMCMNTSIGTSPIHHRITRIGELAFSGTKFETIILPYSVSYIGSGAFSNCFYLSDVYILNSSCTIDNVRAEATFDASVVIHGYEGSTAQTFAETYGYAFAPIEVCPMHVDADHDQCCENCGGEAASHYDKDHDHHCDGCGETLSECVDEDNDNRCDICGEKMKTSFKEIIAFLETLEFEDVDFSHDFYCKMCPLYFMHRDTAIIGPFIRLVHHFVHMGHFIGHVS